MTYLEPELKETAKWMWERKDKTDWWTPLVLTFDNPDNTNPMFSRNKALQIFTILEERRLILPTITTINDVKIQTYKINTNKADEWDDLINKKGLFKLYITPFITSIFKQSWLLILWFVTLIMASTIQSLCKNIIDNFFK